MSQPRDTPGSPEPRPSGWSAQGGQGWPQGPQQPPPDTQGWQPPPPGTQGWPPAGPPPGTQGWPQGPQQPPPGTQGWPPAGPPPGPPPGTQGWPQPPPGIQGWPQGPQQPPPGTQGRPPAAPPPAGPTAPGWQATGSGTWQRDEPPELPPPDARDWDGPVRRRRPPIVAPLVAFLGLAIIAGGTVFAAQRFDLLGTAAAPTATPGFGDPNATGEPIGTYDPTQTDDPFATDTPTSTDAAGQTSGPPPTALETPPPGEQATIAGTLLYTRNGDVWSVSGTTSKQLLGAGNAFMPVWSPDGSTIYYVQETLQRGKVPPWGANAPGRPPSITHLATDIMSMRADGSGRKRRFASMRKEGLGSWSTVATQPAVTPDGKTLILVSDLGIVPTADYDFSPVLLSSMSTSGRGLKQLGVDSAIGAYQKPIGHNDPDVSPDGKRIAFTYDARGGGQGQGQPRIGIIKYPVRKTTPDLSPKGQSYADPSWSPDGRYLAAERVTPDKRDVVILDPDTWEVVARLTTDGRSFAPVWSPNGDQIAYLHADGLDTNVRVMTLAQGATGPTLLQDQAVTVDGKVDPESPPAWFIPSDQRTTVATEAPGASDAGSTAAPEGSDSP